MAPGSAVNVDMTLLSGDTYPLGFCSSVLEIKARACSHFEDAFPPEIEVIEDGSVLGDDQDAPIYVSAIFSCKDRSSIDFWEKAFFACAKIGDRRANLCIDELKKHRSDYMTWKLQQSAERGESEIVTALLAYGTEVNLPFGFHGDTALTIAAQKGHREVVEALILGGADINQADKYGGTALITAVVHRHLHVVESLLKNAADTNKPNHFGSTALICAALDGQASVVEALLRNGANVNQSDKKGNTALYYASCYGHAQVVDILLGHTADVHRPNQYGATPLTCASGHGRADVVVALRKAMNPLEKTSDRLGMLLL